MHTSDSDPDSDSRCLDSHITDSHITDAHPASTDVNMTDSHKYHIGSTTGACKAYTYWVDSSSVSITIM